MVKPPGYILRIATRDWVEQVFSIAVYYTSIRRKLGPQQTIIFVNKTSIGDAIIGYGVIEDVYEKAELSEEEKSECEKHRWEKAVVFRYVVEFEKPLPIRKTFFKETKLRGRCFHGFQLNKDQVASNIREAEQLQHQTA